MKVMDVNPFSDKDHINVFVEVSQGSKNKYEFDEEMDQIFLDRVLDTEFPHNYGLIPRTVSDDGDALDSFVISDEPLVTGTFVKCEILGGIDMVDEKGRNPKIICRPKNSMRPLTGDLFEDLTDFLREYKMNEGNYCEVTSFLTVEEAERLVRNNFMKYASGDVR